MYQQSTYKQQNSYHSYKNPSYKKSYRTSSYKRVPTKHNVPRLEESIRKFAKEFVAFLNMTDSSFTPYARIELKNHQGIWHLSYLPNGKDASVSEEYASRLFLSACPFYESLEAVLNSLENTMDLSDFQLLISLGKQPSYRIDSYEKITPVPEEEKEI